MVASVKANHEPELLVIQRLAEHLASGRNERVTTAHLMAAVAAHPGLAADLLRERRLGSEELLRAARVAVDDEKDPLGLALQRAGEVAQRMRASEPSSAHLMIALLSNRRTAAYRALDQSGVNVSRLRLAAMNLILGLVARRPLENRRAPRVGVAQQGGFEAPVRPALPKPGTLKPQLIKPTTHASRRARVVTPEDLRQHKRVGVAQRAVAPQRVAARLGVSPAPRARGFELSKKKYPLLARVGRNLTLAAANGELDDVVCRDAEVDRVLDVLGKRFANNACLVGPSGVGKTRVVHALAQRLAGARRQHESGDDALPTPDAASDERCPIIIEVSAGQLVMGTQVRGGIGQRMDALRRELAAADGRIVLFFDEIHQLFTGDGGDELSSEFKLAVGRGEMPCIGATTREEYQRSIEADPALARRFSLVEIEEPSREDAYLILQALMPRFEAHHQVQYSEEALARAVAWAAQYIKTRALPDKAVALLDLCGARARRRGEREVTPAQVAEVVSEMIEIPVERLLESDGERMLRLEAALGERIVGHGECLRAIARAIRRNAAGLGARRPIGTFLLLGPTGVGKTETAKALADALFFSEDAMTRVDLSEYSEAHSVARLIGAPPGYIGHEAGGQLTEAVRRKPYQVLLFDELEKAHRDVLQSFLALFDEGRMTDGRGRTIDFTNTIILLTSNLGAAEIDARPRRVGFQSSESDEVADYRRRLIRHVRGALAPELFNRLDDVLVFAPLGGSEIREIAARLLARLARRLQGGKMLELEFDPSVIDLLLADGGFDLKLGARPMQRSLARCVETPLAELLLSGQLAAGDYVLCRAAEGKVTFERRAAPAFRAE
jgi:ATP-dependent Clp protease ATP-binding subunit ClpC